MEQQLTPERWRQVKQMFQAAVELPGAEREAWLADACADDPSLRAEIESLIAAHERPGSFMDTPLFDLVEEPSANPLLGKSLGRYRILALLGRGGVGEVYKAKDTVLGRDVAIKVLSPDFSSDRDRLSRFAQEARAASALNHPNIITIHEFGQADGFHFIVSEFIEGQTLRRLMASRRMSASEILEIAIQIANALNAAHEAGIVHRDIKPENIMARPDGLIKVLDFGLAKLIEPRAPANAANVTEASTLDWGRTGAGIVMGTVNYMSPEQARGLYVDARTDIFSLGVVLYEMITGRSPFARATVADVIASILEKEPPPLAEFTSEATEAMEAIIRKALRKDREERYQTVGELLADLKSLKSGEAVVSPAQVKKRNLADTIKRHWRAAAIALAAVVAMIAGVAYYNHVKPIESVAVLPFANVDGSATTEYLAYGLTENVINTLSQLRDLEVRPRSLVFRYKNRDLDAQAAGRELKVEAVLTGQVTSRGDDLIIDLELIDVRENRQLWGAKYTGRSNDILLTQARIAREVTESLRLQLSSGEQRKLSDRHTNDAAAYQMYLKGRYFWNKRTGEDYRSAIECFTSAIERDPSFALAYAGLADCYVLGGGRYQISARGAMSKARTAATEALKLDDRLAEAHTSLAQVKLYYDWNLAEAEASFKRAIDLKPSYETAHHWYALMLAASGRFTEAIDRIKLAQELDPISQSITKDAGMIYYYARQYDQAVAQCRKVINLHPEAYATYSTLGEAYLQMGRGEEALAELRKADELARGPLLPKVSLGYAYAVLGHHEKALAVLEELRNEAPGRPVQPFYLAVVQTGLGQKDAAFKSLQQAFEERAYRMIYLKVDPAFDTLRSDPRFTKLTRDIGLAQ
jgi:serine/threonine protein kinase/Flp pilus assembly protein TadD